MDDKSKHASSFQIDQDILDARGINMTVEEVSGLSTVSYSERVQALRLNDEDSAFLKGLRRRIKNRLASQNSRRRSVEHLRRLNKELRAVRACKGDAASERRGLLRQREMMMLHCRLLRDHVEKILQQRSDPTSPPSIELPPRPKSPQNESHAHITKDAKIKTEPQPQTPDQIFECRIERLIQQNVNHMYRNEPKSLDSPKKISAKTVFLASENSLTQPSLGGGFKEAFAEECAGVLNLSVKENGRRGHGRKQSAPRRVVYAFSDCDDSVLDLKIKKGEQ